MSYLLLAIGLAVFQSEAVYLPVPRALTPDNVKKDVSPTEGEITFPKSLTGADSTEAAKAFAAIRSEFPSKKGTPSDLKGFIDLLSSPDELVGDAILRWRLLGSVPVLAERSFDRYLNGFQQSIFRFSLEGRLLGIKFGIFSTFQDEVNYQELRGYWQEYKDGRIFWGAGTRVRFSVTRVTSIFYSGPYKAFSNLAKKNIAPPWEAKSDDLVYEVFGSPGRRLSFERRQENRQFGPLVDHVLGNCHEMFLEEMGSDTPHVEPIYIETSLEKATAVFEASR